MPVDLRQIAGCWIGKQDGFVEFGKRRILEDISGILAENRVDGRITSSNHGEGTKRQLAIRDVSIWRCPVEMREIASFPKRRKQSPQFLICGIYFVFLSSGSSRVSSLARYQSWMAAYGIY